MKIDELKNRADIKIAIAMLFGATIAGLTTSNEWFILGALVIFLIYFVIILVSKR